MGNCCSVDDHKGERVDHSHDTTHTGVTKVHSEVALADLHSVVVHEPARAYS